MLRKLSSGFRWGLVVLMAAVAAILMLIASRGDSAIMDELAHIPAGYSYVRYLDSRLNPEHPPLVKILAGIPLVFQGLHFPTDTAAWQKDVNGQWTAGWEFLYQSGNNADRIINWARVGPMLLTLILIFAVYIWSKELMGRWWALLPTFLVALSPTFLAHGHYVTTDVGATLGIFIATATFLQFLYSPSRKKLIWAGLAFGFAQLLKYSAFLLVPYFLLLILAFYFVSIARDWSATDPAIGRTRRFGLRLFRYLRSVLVIFLIGYALVYVVYFFITWNYPLENQVSDTQFILASFSPRFLPEITTWLAGIPGLRPIAEYLLGLLMVFQRSSGGNTVYFLGEVTAAGSPLYFPLVFLMKEPIASLILIFGTFGLALAGAFKSTFAVLFRRSRALMDYVTTNFSEFAMLVFIVLYWASSMSSHLNIGIRHILPTMPFIYILTAEGIKRWFSVKNLESARGFVLKISILYQELATISIKTAILGGLLIWYLISTLITTPYFLSYFNILGGGTRYGYEYVADSNYDWGQDLRRLTLWADANLPEGEKIAVDYFGGGDAKYYLGDRGEYWWSSKGSPINENIGWLAVSINTIQTAKGRLAPNHTRKAEDEYQWLKEPYKPYTRAGTSIFIYKLQ